MSMHQNRLWLVFLAFTLCVTALFVSRAFSQIRAYNQLTTQVPIQIINWQILRERGDHYFVQAHYSYTIDDKLYQSRAFVAKSFKNPWSAQKALTQFEKKMWKAWINPKHPEKSAIYKQYPTKSVLSTLILVVLVIYFIALGFMVGGKDHGRRSQ